MSRNATRHIPELRDDLGDTHRNVLVYKFRDLKVGDQFEFLAKVEHPTWLASGPWEKVSTRCYLPVNQYQREQWGRHRAIAHAAAETVLWDEFTAAPPATGVARGGE